MFIVSLAYCMWVIPHEKTGEDNTTWTGEIREQEII
jgi:hypothetical protein